MSAREEAVSTTVDRTVRCPDCHRLCHFCSWYAKNARSAGCGSTVSVGRRIGRPCEWQDLKGTTCPLCGGSGKMRLVGKLERVAG